MQDRLPPGVGDRGVGGGGGGHGELPDLCRSLPSRRPGLVFLSSQVLQLSLLLADSVPWLPWLASPRLSPGLPSRMVIEVPNDLFGPMSASSSCYFLSLCALFYCSPLPGTPPALCADRGLATMEPMSSRSKMVVRATMAATTLT